MRTHRIAAMLAVSLAALSCGKLFERAPALDVGSSILIRPSEVVAAVEATPGKQLFAVRVDGRLIPLSSINTIEFLSSDATAGLLARWAGAELAQSGKACVKEMKTAALAAGFSDRDYSFQCASSVPWWSASLIQVQLTDGRKVSATMVLRVFDEPAWDAAVYEIFAN